MNYRWELSLAAAGVGAALLLPARSAFAQGCIVGRSCTPGMVGRSNFLMPKELETSLSYRNFRASRHYNGVVEQTQRQELSNFVINRQNIWNLTANMGLNSRSNISLDIPISNSGWSIPRPIGNATTPPGPRSQQNGSGLGDISVSWKTWLRSPVNPGNGNIALGIGIKAPTGKAGLKNNLPDGTGSNVQPRVVDQSIQPGDGGWGFPTSIDAYRVVGKDLTVFGTLNYLINPRDTNGVASGRNPSTTQPSINVYSVPDQYLYRLGIGGPIHLRKVSGLSGSLAWRKEGVPQKDLIGDHHGWRRPGYSTSIEPTLSYSHNVTTYTLSYPITRFRNRIPTNTDGTPTAGDSTFADHQIILSIARRVNLH